MIAHCNQKGIIMKNLKALISIILTTVMILCVLPLSSMAEEANASVTLPEGLSFTSAPEIAADGDFGNAWHISNNVAELNVNVTEGKVYRLKYDVRAKTGGTGILLYANGWAESTFPAFSWESSWLLKYPNGTSTNQYPDFMNNYVTVEYIFDTTDSSSKLTIKSANGSVIYDGTSPKSDNVILPKYIQIRSWSGEAYFKNVSFEEITLPELGASLSINGMAIENGAVGIPATDTLTVTFDQNLNSTSVLAQDFVLKAQDSEENLVSSAEIAGKEVTLKLKEKLNYLTSYTLTIAKNCVEASMAVAPENDYVFSFTTSDIAITDFIKSDMSYSLTGDPTIAEDGEFGKAIRIDDAKLFLKTSNNITSGTWRLKFKMRHDNWSARFVEIYNKDWADIGFSSLYFAPSGEFFFPWWNSKNVDLYHLLEAMAMIKDYGSVEYLINLDTKTAKVSASGDFSALTSEEIPFTNAELGIIAFNFANNNQSGDEANNITWIKDIVLEKVSETPTLTASVSESNIKTNSVIVDFSEKLVADSVKAENFVLKDKNGTQVPVAVKPYNKKFGLFENTKEVSVTDYSKVVIMPETELILSEKYTLTVSNIKSNFANASKDGYTIEFEVPGISFAMNEGVGTIAVSDSFKQQNSGASIIVVGKDKGGKKYCSVKGVYSVDDSNISFTKADNGEKIECFVWNLNALKPVLNYILTE